MSISTVPVRLAHPRGAYYKAFWADPPSCTVGEPRSSYWGENSFPLILQNIHRYMLFIKEAARRAVEPFDRGTGGENPYQVQCALQEMMQDLG